LYRYENDKIIPKRENQFQETKMQGSFLKPLLTVIGLGALTACGGDNPPPPTSTYEAQITRTTYGTPHIVAANVKGLAFGSGYAFAQDNFCVLAEKMLQVNGERSKYFGADSLVSIGSSPIASIKSIDSDFLYRAQYDKATIAALWRTANAETLDMANGYAAGVNQYLEETGIANLKGGCASAAWVRPITADDLFVWWSSVVTISGSQAFAQAIADGNQVPAVVADSGQSPRVAKAKSVKPMKPEQMIAMARKSMGLEAQRNDFGSNAWAFGKDVTENGKGMLLTNPHWPWGGLSKFYLQHFNIPGSLNTMGVAYPGMPVNLAGFNENVAWTLTVSTGPRYIIREMSLDPSSPTKYLLDGVSKPMTARSISIEVLNSAAVTRTYYSTEFGPLIRNSALGLGWTTSKAFAFTDLNLPNNRFIEQALSNARSSTAEQARVGLANILGTPLTNTILTDSTGDAIYTDYSIKPNLSDAKLAACALPGVGQTNTAGGRPVMDGSKTSCNPDVDPSTRQPGVLPPSQLPMLRRTDWVVNANNSYYYTNPAAPITGLPSINGPAAVDITMRPRMNIKLIQERLANTDGLPGGNKINSENIRGMLIGTNTAKQAGNRSMAAELTAAQLTTVCNDLSPVTMTDNTTQDISAVCAALASWDKRFNAESVGAHVFREFWASVNAAPAVANLWVNPFSAADPVNTPNTLNVANAAVNTRLRQSLGTAARRLAQFSIPLNKPSGEIQALTVRGKLLSPGGGSSAEGVANQITNLPLSSSGYVANGGSSFVTATVFGADGPQVDAVLIPGQSVNSDSPHYYDQLEDLWSQRRWHRLPFKPDQINAAQIAAPKTIKKD
jgi:acyl-homoserine-lactone acylase